ncbi:trp operon repressor [candidate division NPL-UPA2 bacterium]|nr:trp operon repressor [candidate division NPL-UPA2 bacterium]
MKTEPETFRKSSAWSSWLSLEEDYRDACRVVKKKREVLNKQAAVDVEKQIMGGMINSLSNTIKMLKEKTIYDFNSLSVAEISVLTDRQKLVAELRQKYTYAEIAAKLNISTATIFETYQQAIKKIKKIRRQKNSDIPVGLTPQQEKIYFLHQQKKKPAEIAKILNTSAGNIRYQLVMIRKNVSKTG